MNIQNLSASERIILAQELWESVHESANDLLVTSTQKAVLEERLISLAADSNPGDSWESVKHRISKT